MIKLLVSCVTSANLKDCFLFLLDGMMRNIKNISKTVARSQDHGGGQGKQTRVIYYNIIWRRISDVPRIKSVGSSDRKHGIQVHVDTWTRFIFTSKSNILRVSSSTFLGRCTRTSRTVANASCSSLVNSSTVEKWWRGHARHRRSRTRGGRGIKKIRRPSEHHFSSRANENKVCKIKSRRREILSKIN